MTSLFRLVTIEWLLVVREKETVRSPRSVNKMTHFIIQIWKMWRIEERKCTREWKIEENRLKKKESAGCHKFMRGENRFVTSMSMMLQKTIILNTSPLLKIAPKVSWII